jgi:hypothetical protein
VSLFTLLAAHRKAAGGEISSWDKAAGTRTFTLAPRGERTVLAASICIVMLIGLAVLNTVATTTSP